MPATSQAASETGKLLCRLFANASELRAFLAGLPVPDLLDSVSDEKVSLAELAFDASLRLAVRGHLDRALFEALAAERPGRSDEIEQICQKVLANAPGNSSSALATAGPSARRARVATALASGAAAILLVVAAGSLWWAAHQRAALRDAQDQLKALQLERDMWASERMGLKHDAETCQQQLMAIESAQQNNFSLVDGRIRKKLVKHPGTYQLVYPSLAIGLSAPDQWRVDDILIRYGGDSLDLIRSMDPSGSISQGIKLQLLAVQSNYVERPELEVSNQLDVLKKLDPNVSVGDTALAGRLAKRFEYQQSTGQRLARVSRIWVRLVPRVKLEVLIFNNLETSDGQFDQEASDILKSLVLDDELLKDREEIP